MTDQQQAPLGTMKRTPAGRQVESAALADLYEPRCPRCQAAVPRGADVVLEALDTPGLFDLDNLINQIGGVLEELNNYSIVLPADAVLAAAMPGWLGINNPAEALKAATEHLPVCRGGGR